MKRKRDSSPTCQDVGQEAVTCLDQGEFSGQLGSHSVGSSGTVRPTSLPEGAETPVFLPGESHGQRSLAGYGLLGCKESDMTEVTEHPLEHLKLLYSFGIMNC